MPHASHRLVRFSDDYDLSGFDCGYTFYNSWLREHAASSIRAGVCAVYLLVEHAGDRERVVGYFAINPTQVASSDMPPNQVRGWPRSVPAWKIGKLAVHVDLRADADAQWGRHLLRAAIETVIRACDVGGGKVIIVDPDPPALARFYLDNGFRPCAVHGNSACYLKVSTARALLG